MLFAANGLNFLLNLSQPITRGLSDCPSPLPCASILPLSTTAVACGFGLGFFSCFLEHPAAHTITSNKTTAVANLLKITLILIPHAVSAGSNNIAGQARFRKTLQFAFSYVKLQQKLDITIVYLYIQETKRVFRTAF